MKQSIFLSTVIVVTAVVAFVIFEFVLGNPANFRNGELRTVPDNLLGTVYTGGIIVPILIGLTLMNLTLVFERIFSLRKANGKRSITVFLKGVQTHLMSGRIDDAIKECDAQRGSAANIIRTGLERYKAVANEKGFDAQKKMSETQRAIEEATSLETPLLERNLIALSTIASIATMFGLLGTVIGMIRAFTALAKAGGAPDAIQLSIGISEALINTALGLLAAIIGIVAGLLVVGSIVFVERVLKVDDPVGAVSVHGVNGLWGLISLGLFADGTYGNGWNGVEGTVRGLFYGGGGGQLAAQVIDAVVVVIWAFGLMYVFFRIQKRVQGIRVTRDEEMIGLDVPEMGVPAYPASLHL